MNRDSVVAQDNLGASGRAAACSVTILVTQRGEGKDAGRMPGSLSLLSHGAHHIFLEIPIHEFLNKITSVKSEPPLPRTGG